MVLPFQRAWVQSLVQALRSHKQCSRAKKSPSSKCCCSRGPAFVADEVSRKLSDMYSQELRLKRTVVEQLAHTADRDLALSYLSMWLHQPYLEAGSWLLLESMLLETGHRVL